MNIMDAMMGGMMNRMSKEEKADMMDRMMARFFEGMTKEDKQKMMQDMMPRMMEGMTMMDMMAGMMSGGMPGDATGSVGEQEGMPGMMAGMMGDDCTKGTTPPMAQMMEKMMPHCLEMMLPQIPKEARSNFAVKLIKSLLDNGAAGMSEDEKKEYLKNITEAIQANATPG